MESQQKLIEAKEKEEDEEKRPKFIIIIMYSTVIIIIIMTILVYRYSILFVYCITGVLNYNLILQPN